MSSIQTKPADTTFSYWLTVGVNEPEQIPGTGLFGLKFKDIPSTHHLPFSTIRDMVEKDDKLFAENSN